MNRVTRSISTLIILCAVLAACGGGKKGTAHDRTKVAPGSYLSVDQIGHKSFCSNVDGFCANFPYISSNDSFSNFNKQTIAADAKDATPEFRSYNSMLSWGYTGKMVTFCRTIGDSVCFNRKLAKSGVPADTYFVFVFADQPGQPLSQFDQDCNGWLNRHATATKLAGESALHVTCTYQSNHNGVHDLYYLRHGGKVYEVGALDQVRTPFFGRSFFKSFRFQN